MISLLLLLSQQILNDQGIDYDDPEIQQKFRKLCSSLKKDVGLNLRASKEDEGYLSLLFLLFKGDIARNPDAMKKSIVKRISTAADNLIGDDSVIRKSSSQFSLDVRNEDKKRAQTAWQSKLISNEEYKFYGQMTWSLGKIVRFRKKMFKYSDYNKPTNGTFKLKGIDNFEFFELTIDMFANSININLPVGITVILDLDDIINLFGSGTKGKSKKRKLSFDSSIA